MVASLINCARSRLHFTIQNIVLQRLACKFYSDDVKDKSKVPPDVNDKSKLPPHLLEPPTNCCMSGCENCVYVKYAEELTEYFRDGGEQAQKLILEIVDDPNMGAFLLSELRMLKLRNKKE